MMAKYVVYTYLEEAQNAHYDLEVDQYNQGLQHSLNPVHRSRDALSQEVVAYDSFEKASVSIRNAIDRAKEYIHLPYWSPEIEYLGFTKDLEKWAHHFAKTHFNHRKYETISSIEIRFSGKLGTDVAIFSAVLVKTYNEQGKA